MPPLAPSSVSSDGLFIRRLQLVAELEVRRNQVPDEPLLLHDAAARIDHLEAEFLDDPIVLLEDLALKQPKTLGRVGAPTEIHPGLVKLQLDASSHQAVERHLDRHAEIQREVGPHRES